MFGTIAVLAQLAISVSASDTVALDGVAEITVRVTTPAGIASALVPPPFRPFMLVRHRLSHRVEIDLHGQRRMLAEHRYSLAPSREGTVVLSPFVATAAGESVRSAPVRIVVRDLPHGRGGRPAIVARTRIDADALVNFRAYVTPETVFVGQQARYQLGVFLDESVRDRIRRMEALAPDMRRVMAYDPAQPLEVLQVTATGGRRYEAHVYQRAVVPLAPGRIAIPPARLLYSLPLTFSFFSREENYELKSDSAIIIAIDPPAEGRPRGYSGSVGQIRASVRLDTTAGRVGDPLALTVRLSGEGNVKLWPRPELNIPGASVVPAGDRVTLGADRIQIRGAKDFEWVLTPERDGELIVPSIEYPYFDPASREYSIAQTVPETLSIARGALATLDSARSDTASRLEIRSAYRGELPAPLYSHENFWLLLAFAPAPALAVLIARRPWVRRRKRTPAAELRRMAAQRDDAMPAAEIRRVFIAASAARINVNVAELAERSALPRMARRAGVSATTAAEIAAMLEMMDRAAFGPGGRAPSGLARRAHDLYRAIDRETRPLGRAGSAALFVVLILLVAGPLVAAARLDTAEEDFMHGVRAYRQGHYTVATRAFTTVAESAPKAPDAWANLGTAAWAGGDSALAALGWHRALLLEPLALDLRDRIPLNGITPRELAVLVPPMPPRALILSAALVWIVCGLWCAVRVARRARATLQVLGGTAFALVLAGAGWALDARLQGRDIGVVQRRASVHVLPALSADTAFFLRTAETARIVERRGGWVRVMSARDEDGWIPSAALIPLERD
ncbi:MAG: BatD family protein [Anaerolineae bacterium]|nr:BatD family protein [Gemmatimonadaceae bacterium]